MSSTSFVVLLKRFTATEPWEAVKLCLETSIPKWRKGIDDLIAAAVEQKLKFAEWRVDVDEFPAECRPVLIRMLKGDGFEVKVNIVSGRSRPADDMPESEYTKIVFNISWAD